MANGNLNNFVGTLDELLRFLEAYQEDLFYFDINPSVPPTGARQFEITTFPAVLAEPIVDEIHPAPTPPRLTPLAKARIEAARPPEPDPSTAVVECGMNIHPYNQQGYPLTGNNKNLSKAAWVRFPFMSSPARFPSLEQAFAFFDPVIAAFNAAHVKVLLVMNHEMYGEGSEFNLGALDSNGWAAFSQKFIGVAEQVVRRYKDTVQGYEIWNEGDVDPGNPAAVHFPPRDYALMLDKLEPIIRKNAPEAYILLGGLVKSPESAAQYVSAIKSTLGGRLPLDAIGYHPYGKGAPNDVTVFSRLGNIADDIRIINKAAPNVPIWLTEVGALGTDDPAYWDDAALYMQNFFRYIRAEQAAKVPVIVWYAWSDGMHVEMKTNGILTKQGELKPHLYEAFFSQACK